jgi:hypothetical protein
MPRKDNIAGALKKIAVLAWIQLWKQFVRVLIMHALVKHLNYKRRGYVDTQMK